MEHILQLLGTVNAGNHCSTDKIQSFKIDISEPKELTTIQHSTEKQIVFVVGLPFSGQQKIVRTLTQNPAFAGTLKDNCIIHDFVVFWMEWPHGWGKEKHTFTDGHIDYISDNLLMSQGESIQEHILGGLRGLIDGYWRSEMMAGQTVLEKHRGWASQIQLLVRLFGERCKIIYCVRNLEQIICRALKRENMGAKKTTVRDLMRCEGNNTFSTGVGGDAGWIGLPYTRFIDNCDTEIFTRFGKYIRLIDYSDLTANPGQVIPDLHRWILGNDAPTYAYDYRLCKANPLDPKLWLTEEERAYIRDLETANIGN